jgi:hypothetical protein
VPLVYFDDLPNKTFSRKNQFIRKRIDKIRILLPKYRITLPVLPVSFIKNTDNTPVWQGLFALIKIEPINIPIIPPRREEM